MDDRDFKRVSVTALFILTFLAGSLTTYLKVFPYPALEKYFKGLDTFLQMISLDPHADSAIWPTAVRTKGQGGVTQYDPGKAFNGYTLFSPANSQEAHLIDMHGNLVHKWKKPFSDLWEDPPHIDEKVQEIIVWHGFHLYPNGDLLVVYNGLVTPTGYGLVKLDKDSHVIWKYAGRAHHDVDVGPDGRIYTLTMDVREEGHPALPHLGNEPLIDDRVAVLSEEGEPIKSISIFEAIKNSPRFRSIIDYLGHPDRYDISVSTAPSGDHLHANAIRYIGSAAAQNVPLFKEGQLLLSLRETDILAVLDPETETIVWAVRGFWRAQHNPELLENGKILIFDNQGSQKEKTSRILEFDPATSEVTSVYEGTSEQPFYSELRGTQQHLPNGNILISEYQHGRILEVTPQGEIVWEYLTKGGGPDEDRLMVVHGAWRYAPDELTFLEQEEK